MVVACLGASHTEAKANGSYNWIGDLQSRPQNVSIRFVNLGVGGDLAYSALKRLPQVIQCRPNKVVVLIGTNDVVTTIFQNARRFLGTWKRLPQEPSPKWYEENLRQIVRRLNNETTAHVALCSLAVIGEDPESMDTPQREVNKRIEEYSAIVKRIAHEESASYIPFYERMHEQIVDLLAAPSPNSVSYPCIEMRSDSSYSTRVLMRSGNRMDGDSIPTASISIVVVERYWPISCRNSSPLNACVAQLAFLLSDGFPQYALPVLRIERSRHVRMPSL
jgi:lysophospholipase L1-like esterase